MFAELVGGPHDGLLVPIDHFRHGTADVARGDRVTRYRLMDDAPESGHRRAEQSWSTRTEYGWRWTPCRN